MEVAIKLVAVNTPLSVDDTVRFKKSSIRVSYYDTVIEGAGKIVGYTTLLKSKSTADNRVEICGSEFVYYQSTEHFSDSDVKYCLCVNDITNEWVVVLPKSFSAIELDDTKKEHNAGNYHSERVKAAAFVGISALCIGIAAIAMSGENEAVVNSTESSEDISSGAVNTGNNSDVTYTASGDYDTETMEGELEEEIVYTKEEAEKEKEGVSAFPAILGDEESGTVASTDDSSNSESNTSDSENKDKTVDPPFSSAKDTVIVQEFESSGETTDPTAKASYNSIGNITLSDSVDSISVKNSSDYTLTVKMYSDDSVYIDSVIEPGKSESFKLADKITETQSVVVEYTYTTETGSVASHYLSEVMVTVL